MRIWGWVIAMIAVVIGALVITAYGFGVRLDFDAGRDFDPDAAIEAGEAYDAEILRDEWGIPRVIGVTDADAAFAIAYAHAEDDFATIQDSLRAALGPQMLAQNESEARTAYLVQLLRLREQVEADYDTALSETVQAMLEAYANGLNLYAAHHTDQAAKDLFPVTGHDVAVLTAFFSPLFYGLGDTLAELAAPETEQDPARGQELQVMIQQGPATELGSNAFAVAPFKSDDGWTRAFVNSHQPVDGALAWYEGQMISGEGLNMVGGMFPGAPAIHLGVNPGLAQAATVNYPDLIDVYELVLDGEGYVLDGQIQPFDTRTAEMTVQLLGPVMLKVSRPARWSAHGPVLDTDHGSYAIRYATLGDIRFIEQAYRMMRARTREAFEAALNMGAMGNTNRVIATRDGEIARYYLARMPLRDESANVDWSGVLPGDNSALIWQDFAPFAALPHMVNPQAGFVLDANHSPFEVTQGPDDPVASDYPAQFGIETHMTNRGRRAVSLMGGFDQISRDDLFDVKYDNAYDRLSFAGQMQARIAAMELDDDLAEAGALIAEWDRHTDLENPQAGLAIMTALRLYERDSQIEAHSDEALQTALAWSADLLTTHHGRIDPRWDQVNFLYRGAHRVALAGGPDTLRAANSIIDDHAGLLRMLSGDGLHMLAEWAPGSDYPDVFAVHQFGASQDPSSPHYDDQMDMFAQQRLRPVPMREADIRARAIESYRPGQARE